MNPVFVQVSSYILSYVFVTAALHKWRGRARFEGILQNYRVLPRFAVRPAAVLLPPLEFALGVALFPGGGLAAWPAAALLILYSAAIALNLLRGRRSIDCGCGGTEHGQTLSEWLLLRNAILIVFATLAAVPMSARSLAWYEWIIVLFASGAGCLFYHTGNLLLVNRDLLRNLRLNNG